MPKLYRTPWLLVAPLLMASAVAAQQQTPPTPLPPGQTVDPFPQPIAATEGVITVGVPRCLTLTALLHE
jgi:hypothetical protein